MEASFLTAVNVSILAMSVIFIVLIVLIFTIQLLVKLIPYEAPPPAPSRRRQAAVSGGEQDDHVAAITASLAMHLGKSPDEFRIVNISQP
jgi:sodium pump decarboxylase gamma subunit